MNNAPRIALYSHDTMGLGHIRRTSLLARALRRPPLNAHVLLLSGIRESLASSAKRDAGEEIPLTERDLSMKTVIGVTVGSMLPIGVLLWLFLHGTSMAHHTAGLIIASILFILLTGLVVASVCGSMAGRA